MSESALGAHYTDEPWQRLIAAALRAAYAWTVREVRGNAAMREIARMTGVVMEVHGPGRGPVTPAALIESLHTPLRGLLVGIPQEAAELADIVLLNGNGNLTERAYDLVCEHVVPLREAAGAQPWLPTWVTMNSDQIRHRAFTAMIATTDQDEYVASRKFLVEHPAGGEQELVEQRDRIGGVRLAGGSYQTIPEGQVYRDSDHRGWWWPCPDCKWPMAVSGSGTVRCRYRPHSAVFDLLPGTRPKLRRRDDGPRAPLPTGRTVDGAKCVDAGVWRFVVVTGISELRIAAAAERAKAEVRLWPLLDRYDLSIEAASEKFTVDVKECLSLSSLINRLRTRPPSARILLPKSFEWQLEPLVDALPGLTVTTEARFLSQIRAAVRKSR
ncbi:restriction endonuclease-related protein [Amycolatopsis thermoflava]|uniref:restriction endonuclease-related protein n=1 Tax=Amycolatopsis thermoflava TaxID=84480 RepID=UPI000482207D|nr:hypothetical protein [Amycolatopsis thermoflava]